MATLKQLETLLDKKVDEKFDLLEENLKEYIKGYFEDVKRVTQDIQRNQNFDREVLGKWDNEIIPEIRKNVWAIKNKILKNSDDITREVAKTAKEAVAKNLPNLIKNSVASVIENNSKVLVKKRYLWGVVELFKGKKKRNANT